MGSTIVTEKTLEDHLQTLKSVRLEYDWELTDYQQTTEGVQAVFKNSQGVQRVEQAQFLVGCDGLYSSVRQAMGIKHNPKGFKATFLMGDFIDRTDWKDDAHLFFTSLGAVESFPLGQGKRRWIVQTPYFMQEPKEYLEAQVLRRTGLYLPIEDCTWKSPFGIHRWVSPVYAQARVYLAGDSAHQMSPIGGQGMNTGFADAEFLAALLETRLQGTSLVQEKKLNHLYTKLRRKAGASAAKRAEMSMALGTVTGFGSSVRKLILKTLLNTAPQFFPPHYSMLTIPCRNVGQVKAHYRALRTLKPLADS